MLNSRYFPNVKQAVKEFLAEVKAEFIRLRYQMLAMWTMVVTLMLSAGMSFAQVSIDISPEDLNVFFDWFNTMFGVILPIALIGAGLVAGAVFAFTVGNMLKKAFQSLGGGG